MKNYTVREPIPDTIHAELADFPLLTRNLLFYRGINTKEKAIDFLSPDYEKHIHNPLLLKDVEKASKRVWQAIRSGEVIAIYSDYDADGVPAAVILHDFFKKIGYTHFLNYIPHRHDEGFGLHIEAIDTLIKKEVKVIITLDCGIADVAEVAHAQSKGVDVIVTDHHLPLCSQDESGKQGEKLPSAFAIINPKQSECGYPEKMLCGSGVAFKLVQALIKTAPSEKEVRTAKINWPLKDGVEKWFLDMAGIGTLSDMVPLTGENRVLAHFGLKVLRKSPRLGLLKLLRALGTDQRFLTEEDVGFTISPRINAASRMGVPYDAFRLLSTTDADEAHTLALHLNEINDERKGIVAQITKEVKAIIRERYADSPKEVIVMGNPKWKPTILGLVANALMNDHARPVFLWGRETGTVLKGSCRSDGSVDVTALMSEAREYFHEYGGHALSGGFSVVQEKVHLLEDALNVAYHKVKTAFVAPVVYADARLSVDEVTEQLYAEVERLSPFGVSNPKPIFLFESVLPNAVKNFGKQKNHLELSFKKQTGGVVKAIGFFMAADDFKELTSGKPFSLVATLEKSYFRNMPELRLRIVDIVE